MFQPDADTARKTSTEPEKDADINAIGRVVRIGCFAPNKHLTIDAALIAMKEGIGAYTDRIFGMDDLFSFGVYVVNKAPKEGDPVEFFGSTTGFMTGTISSTAFNTMQPFRVDINNNEAAVLLEDQITIDVEGPQPTTGDSGALVLGRDVAPSTNSKPAVGLFWGSHNETKRAVASKITNVFSQFNLTTLCEGAISKLMNFLFLGYPIQRFDSAVLTPVEQAPSEIARTLRIVLSTSKAGRVITDFVHKHRSVLTTLILTRPDVRQLIVSAIAPSVRGATTAEEVIRRPLSTAQLNCMLRLADLVERDARPDMARSLQELRGLARGAAGRCLGEVLSIDGRFGA